MANLDRKDISTGMSDTDLYHPGVRDFLKIIRKETFARSVWKNGGGVTHEAIRVPSGDEPFSWRVSVAHIEKSGPFSDFAGYRRRMLLLQGRGLELSFGDGRRSKLREIGDWVEFDGAASTHCELVDGPCIDLNLMTVNSLPTTAKLELLQDGFTVEAASGQTILVFSLAAALALGDEAGGSTRLDAGDLALLSQGTLHLGAAEPGRPSIPIAVFIATISQ
jgi:environmental stress-induced protein Ves